MSTAKSPVRDDRASKLDSVDSILPYADMADEYLRLGYSPLPLPVGKKFPPPDGYTGASGKLASDDDVSRWTREQPNGNIALRVPVGVIGLDLDAYKGELERRACEDLFEQYGELPDGKHSPPDTGRLVAGAAGDFGQGCVLTQSRQSVVS